MRSYVALIGIGIAAAVAACSGADEHPLGGPYGGTSGGLNGPTNGAATSNGDDQSATPSSSDESTSASSDPGTSDAGKTTTHADAGSSSNNNNNSNNNGNNSNNTPSSPTWSSIYQSYLASGTVGNCGPCHSSMRTAAGAYTYLQRKGYISGSSSALADPQQSCLSWLGGNMPPNGPSSNAKAASDLTEWAKAGGLQN